MISYTVQQFRNMTPFYVETVMEGFDQYPNQMLEGTKEELKKIILGLAKADQYNEVYGDCYFGRLTEEEKTAIRQKYSEEFYQQLERIPVSEEALIVPVNEKILEVLLTLSLDEMLFSTFYFVKSGYIIWSNYEQKFPVFFQNKQTQKQFAIRKAKVEIQ